MSFEKLITEIDDHTTYGDKASEIKEVMNGIFENPPSGMHIIDTDDAYFTDHGAGHSERILKLLTDFNIKTPSNFTELESFLLISSAWLHDIGMYLGRPRRETILEVSARARGRIHFSRSGVTPAIN